MCRVPDSALHEIIYDPKYADINIRRFVANAIERHESTVSRLLSEQAKMDQDQAARLGRKLSDELDDYRWSQCFVGSKALIIPKTFGTANGVWDDDFGAAVDAAVEWRRKMEEGDEHAARVQLGRLRKALADMEAETNEL